MLSELIYWVLLGLLCCERFDETQYIAIRATINGTYKTNQIIWIAVDP
jgi:hypothetical protein